MVYKQAYSTFPMQWLRPLYLLLFLSLPFSLDIAVAGALVSVPAEPLMLLIALLTGISAWKYSFPWRTFIRHPIAIVSLVYLLWMALMIPFSTMPVVSVKYFFITLLHWWVCFVGVLMMAFFIKTGSLGQTDGDKDDPMDIRGSTGLLNVYLLPFLVIVLYAWWVHGHYDFRSDTSSLAARPFYFDHTAYSVCMAMLFWVPWWSRRGSYEENNEPSRWQQLLRRLNAWRSSPALILLVRGMLLTGVFLSFSRATWIAMAAASGTWFFRRLWEKSRLMTALLAAFLVLSITLVIVFYPYPAPGGDASSLERYNRYSCAWRMFLDRPLTGFGAGTFPEQYLVYQRPEEMTRISVTRAGLHIPGRGGSTHSEYLQALAELGLVGALCWIVLAGFVLVSVFRYPLRSPATMMALGLLTYMIHACFNNFLHTDKIGVLVWVFLATLYICHQKSKNSTQLITYNS